MRSYLLLFSPSLEDYRHKNDLQRRQGIPYILRVSEKPGGKLLRRADIYKLIGDPVLRISLFYEKPATNIDLESWGSDRHGAALSTYSTKTAHLLPHLGIQVFFYHGV